MSYEQFLQYFRSTTKPEKKIDCVLASPEAADLAAKEPIKIEMTLDRISAGKARVRVLSNANKEILLEMFKEINPRFLDDLKHRLQEA